MTHPRLLNRLFECSTFLVDSDSLPMIIRDIVNMNWWNTCDYLLGYKDNKRQYSSKPDRKQLNAAMSLFEWYYVRNEHRRDEQAFRQQIRDYISGNIPAKTPSQLRLFSAPYRRNYSQYYYKNGKPTWLTCTSRAKYSYIICAQNAVIDFDGACRLTDAQWVIDFIDKGYCHDLGAVFVTGDSVCKAEIFTQKKVQHTIEQWIDKLEIKIIPERQWLYDAIKHVRSDPYKVHEAHMIAIGQAQGVNELMYVSDSTFTRASHASSASRASHASHASCASNAGNVSHAGNAQGSSYKVIGNELTGDAWANSHMAYGPIPGLDYPKEFHANVFGMAGHWKINEDLVKECKAWFDPFSGHGESPMIAARNGVKYYGIELNSESFNGYIKPIILDELSRFMNADITCINGDSREYKPELNNSFDLCYTSPPYWNFEEYGGTNPGLKCETIKQFYDDLIIPIFKNVYQYLTDNGVLALQVGTCGKKAAQWVNAIESCGFKNLSKQKQGTKNEWAVHSRSWQNLLIFSK